MGMVMAIGDGERCGIGGFRVDDGDGDGDGDGDDVQQHCLEVECLLSDITRCGFLQL